MAVTEAPPVGPPARTGGPPSRHVAIVVVLAVTIPVLLMLATAYIVKEHVLQAFFIPAPSMEPTLRVGDRIIVNKLSDVDRGDIVVFELPPVAGRSGAAVKELVKRIVAMEGDAVESRGNTLQVNGEPVDEPYLRGPEIGVPVRAQTVPPGQIFVLGDNRTNSADSRVFGPVDEDAIVGHVILVWSNGKLRRL